jgi:hypothetical protein
VKAWGCRHRDCCNPAHLEPVTRLENIRRAVNWQAVKTHCAKGHEYDLINTYWAPGGSRNCRPCNLISVKAYQQRQRDKLMGRDGQAAPLDRTSLAAAA